MTETKAAREGQAGRSALGAEEAGARLKTAREEAGISREAMAADLGCSSDTIRNYESGRTEARRSDIERYAQLTRRPLSFFFYTSDSIPETK